MGIFDTIKDKAGDLASDAERAGKLGAAQVKLKSLQGDVRDALARLGEEAFALVEKGELSHPGLEAAVAGVRDAKKLVADKEEEIARIKAEG
ncbi:MAG TPA: hypothetical protein PLB30_08340 [Thermoleophilia bacterium]|nr:hypothetical protein [Thermoleophilia bacterium]HQG03025.1 hypothetical protein [Thermoleophilia bacterium]HQG54520.1 hypothetical protein [Thermoleophilia bacterium]HQJ98531.1 hypothetical protein [Thermoleophilia bacterium]